MNLTPKSKTSFVILEILIQNQVKADEYYIETYRGKDDAQRIDEKEDIKYPI
jgi:hypothetical protein